MFVEEQLRQLHWHHFQRVPQHVLPSPWRDWVLDRGSLTKRLIETSDGDFRVEVISQRNGFPLPTELEALGLTQRQSCIIREVALICFDQPWVYARSIVPNATLSGSARRLAHLGNKPLGAFLFNAPDMERGPLELTQYHNLFKGELIPGEPLSGWGRRSVFYLGDKPLLVCEFFTPRIISHEQCQEAET
ncbi:hypothetical protein BTA51_01265 [Hahella sp. CCB-MM4]|uniref:chorismate--pyruvate lyase family protein n=1 Tax=Hahella sp. (strain CCB-MM4) TaxID=1926491 RepID=UPI000BC3C4EE|nr:chorismate lyase [Hahella sp. CCB-MM4]OZG75492.1 hypothetical protein BTA51_01265 [Hahella sp. CCB-MM4]